MGSDVRTRFESKVKADPETGCHVWHGARNPKGYGQFHWPHGRTRLRAAHRASYELHIGPVPDELEVDHLCKNRACVNPEHLELVTHAENVARSRPTHCTNGHELTPDNVKPTSLKRGKYRGRRCRRCFNDQRRARRQQRRV